MDDYTSDKLIGMYGDLMAEYALLKIEKKDHNTTIRNAKKFILQ